MILRERERERARDLRVLTRHGRAGRRAAVSHNNMVPCYCGIKVNPRRSV